jgi:cytosine/adenosine deaminase-related metal-dependent hydrolase
LTSFSADWILPISDAPLDGGVVTLDDGRIVSVAPGKSDADVALGRAVVLPGLVNAHTHLELSYLRGRIAPAARFLDWVRPMLAARRERSSIDDAAILRAAAQAIQEARATGTALVGEVTNTLATVSALADAGMPAHVFHELIGFGGVDVDKQVASARRAIDAVAGGAVADDAVTDDAVAYDAIAVDRDVRLSLAPHAPYSVSPALFAAIRRDLDAHAPTVSTVHLGESPEEVEFLKSGAGPWRTLLEDLGVWNDQWEAPQSSPVEYLAEMGLLTASMLAVHGVQFDGADLDRLRTLGVTLVSCPRSNRYVGVGSPPLEAFYAMDVEVAFGTDSLASVDDLNMFSELAEARRIAPKVPARTLLRSATLTGAGALGFGDQFGSIEPGKRAALIAVRVPEGVSDVEEYLVSGIQPSAIQWLMSTPNSQIPTST